MTPRLVGPYVIEDELGKGGMGVVYSGIDRVLERPVAIKALLPEVSGDKTFVERFRSEAASLARLNHQNITTLYSLFQEGTNWYMVMELVNGQPLDKVLARVERLDAEEALAVVTQVAAGLGYAHRMGVIHRDIKPSNLMVTESGSIKIMDFGIARIAGSKRVTQAGLTIGTLAYLAPELIKEGKEGNEQSDLYSLGIVCYELLSGNPPFAGDSDYALATAQIQEPPPPLVDRLPGLDPKIEATLLKALAKNPEDRFPGVEAFSQAIGATAIRADADRIVRERIVDAPGALPASATRALDIGTALAEADRLGPIPATRAMPMQEPTRSLPLPLPALIAGGIVGVAILGAGLAFALHGSSDAIAGQVGDPVPFLNNQIVLTAPAQPVIATEAAFIKDHPDIALTVKGYCTPEEGKRFGPGVLAKLRANKVRDELADRSGVPKSRIQTAADNACDAAAARAILVRN
jgi:eukaryotic-like serine/threonine-protein kinase